MSSNHKDLPPGSQKWASEVDKDRAELLALREVVRRLAENAGIDFANPKRGVNTGDTPSVKSPVGQKLSSLADVQTYNVADKQVLSWNQKGQQWLPVTPETGGDGSIDVDPFSYSHQDRGYGKYIDGENYAYTAADAGDWGGSVELWASDNIFIGQGSADFDTYGVIHMVRGSYDPWISIMAVGTDSVCELLVADDNVNVSGGTFTIERVSTSTRPTGLGPYGGESVYDDTLKIPIWWSGTTWTNALGTAV